MKTIDALNAYLVTRPRPFLTKDGVIKLVLNHGLYVIEKRLSNTEYQTSVYQRGMIITPDEDTNVRLYSPVANRTVNSSVILEHLESIVIDNI